MTDTKIIDLDDLVSPDKTVKLGGRDYIIPGDMPLETYLRINRIAQREDDDDTDQEEQVDEMVDIVASLLVIKIPEADREAERQAMVEKIRARGVKLVMRAISTIYKDDDEEAVDSPEGDAVPPTGTGTTTTNTSPQTEASAS